MADNAPTPLLNTEAIVDNNGRPTRYFLRQWLAQNGVNTTAEQSASELMTLAADVQTALQAVDALSMRQLTAGVGLDGGGDLTADRTFDLADTAVTPGTFGDATNVSQITVDQQGRITSAQNVPVQGGGGGSSITSAFAFRTSDGPSNGTWPKFLSAQQGDANNDPGIWDIANPDRLTVPPGATRIRLTATLAFTTNTNAVSFFMSFVNAGGFTSFVGNPIMNINADPLGFTSKIYILSSPIFTPASTFYRLRVNVSPTYTGGFLIRSGMAMEVYD